MSGKTQNGLTFSYKKLSETVYRPIIRIEISGSKGKDGVPCEVLVDSGADFCILKAEIGEILGLDIKSGETFEYVGINGAKSAGYVHDVWIAVKNHWMESRVVFSYDIPKSGHQVVGQKGFFGNFKISFDYKKGSIVLRV